MRVAITGATGFIGSALSQRLRALGHQTTAISRTRRGPGSIIWDPREGRLDPSALAGHDAVVHLAGEPIAPRPWTASRRKRIHDSRTLGTDLVARTMAATVAGENTGDARRMAPRTLVSASGIHYYGDGGDRVLTEESPAGEGFLAGVCRDWEAATAPAREAGIRVVRLRVGIPQSPKGDFLKFQLPLYKAGLGGRLGSGGQWVSWIGMEDLLGIVLHSLENNDLEGPVNATGPNPVTQAEYATTLAHVLRRPTLLPVPRFAPRLVLGQLAEELLFISLRVAPERAMASGYTFRQPGLEEALRAVLGRPSR